MAIYARFLALRNCGRFLHLASDFGSHYRTHGFLTSEALYAGLTREASRRRKFIDLQQDNYDFQGDYDLHALPLWFTPGVFRGKTGPLMKLPDAMKDTNQFNVLDEGYPGTGGGGRKYYRPTYGSMETVLPGNTLTTHALAAEPELPASFRLGSVFLMGKKRTMFQLVEVTETIKCDLVAGGGEVGPCEVVPTVLRSFQNYRIWASTARYLLVSGFYRGVIVKAGELSFPLSLLPGGLSHLAG